MEQQTYRPKVKDVECEMFPLLPGIGSALEATVEYPEVRLKHAVKAEFERWKVDDTLTAAYWLVPNRMQTGFITVEQFIGQKKLKDYYQVEYYQIPQLIRDHIDKLEGTDRTWIVTEVNNEQMREWLYANSVLIHSEEIIANSMKNRDITFRDVPPLVDEHLIENESGTLSDPTKDNDEDAAA